MAEPNFANRTLFHGDNLGFLQGLNSGSVHLIATDPPFNKGRDFHATPDSPRRRGQVRGPLGLRQGRPSRLDRRAQGLRRAAEAHEAEGEYQQGLACVDGHRGGGHDVGQDMGGVPLLHGRAPAGDAARADGEGSLYLHCDPTASHYLKIMLDAIFGKKNFRNEIIWKRTSAHANAHRCGSIHDVILFYSNSDDYTWNPVLQEFDPEYVEQYYRYTDEDGRSSCPAI